MSVERRGPAVCDGSNNMGGKGGDFGILKGFRQRCPLETPARPKLPLHIKGNNLIVLADQYPDWFAHIVATRIA